MNLLKPPYSIDGWRFDVADIMGRREEPQLSHELWPGIRKSIEEADPQTCFVECEMRGI